MSEPVAPEFFRGYAAALTDVERRLVAGLIGDDPATKQDLAILLDDLRVQYDLPPGSADGVIAELKSSDPTRRASTVAWLKLSSRTETIKSLVMSGLPTDVAYELASMAARSGRSMPDDEDDGDPPS